MPIKLPGEKPRPRSLEVAIRILLSRSPKLNSLAVGWLRSISPILS